MEIILRSKLWSYTQKYKMMYVFKFTWMSSFHLCAQTNLFLSNQSGIMMLLWLLWPFLIFLYLLWLCIVWNCFFFCSPLKWSNCCDTLTHWFIFHHTPHSAKTHQLSVQAANKKAVISTKPSSICIYYTWNGDLFNGMESFHLFWQWSTTLLFSGWKKQKRDARHSKPNFIYENLIWFDLV